MFSTLYVAFVGRRGTWAHWPSKAWTLNSFDLLAGVVLEHSQCQNMICFQHFILFLLAGVVFEHTDPPKRKLLNLCFTCFWFSLIFMPKIYYMAILRVISCQGWIPPMLVGLGPGPNGPQGSILPGIYCMAIPKLVLCIVSLCHHASTYHLKSFLMRSSFGSVWTGSNIPRIFTYTLTSTSSLKLIHTNTSCLLFAKKSKGHGREGYDFPKECSSQSSVLVKVLLFSK